MKSAYITKRIAPIGYVAVTKPLAQVLYDEMKEITVCGNNVNSYHVFNGWRLSYTFQKDRHDNNSFNVLLNSFMFYLEPELGTYPVFYVKREDIQSEKH